MVTNKFLGVLAVGGLLLVQAASSRAVQVNIVLSSPFSNPADIMAAGDPAAGADLIGPGIGTTNNVPPPGPNFSTSLQPGATNNLTLLPVNHFSSGFTYSAISAFFNPVIGTPNTTYSGSYANVPADFEFNLTVNGGPTQTFVARGHLVGDMQITTDASGIPIVGATSVSWIAGTNDGNAHNAFYDVTNGMQLASVDATNPAGLEPSQEIFFKYDPTGLDIPIQLMIDDADQVQPPVAGFPQSAIRGWVSTVPEPGTVAMLFGSSLTGSLLLRRRRRA